MGNLIRAVTFDLWNTLVHNRNYGEFRLPKLREFLKANGVELDDARLMEVYQAGFRYSSELHRESGRRHVMTDEIVGHVMDQVGLRDRCDWAPLVNTYEEAILSDPPKLREGARETLEYLHGRVRIGLISDTGTSPGRVVRRILDEYGVLSYFDVTVFSDEVGYCKPNEVVFKVALEVLGVEPGEALHVGDLVKNDVVGAKRAGMRTAWLKTTDQEYSPEDAPDYIISSLTEVIGIVEAAG
ncbi:MAG TPA: HAD family hydrolase [Candidatus Bathyarchaeia archaeon]